MNNADFDEQVRLYCRYFYTMSTKFIFVPGTDLDFVAVVYDMGVMLKVQLSVKNESADLDTHTQRPVTLCTVSSVLDAFDKIGMAKGLDEHRSKGFVDALAHELEDCRSTVITYDWTGHKIYLIKGKDQVLWDFEAAKIDVRQVLLSFDRRG